MKNAQQILIPKPEKPNAHLVGTATLRGQDQTHVVSNNFFCHHLSLDASTNLYMGVYPMDSVQPSVCWSVGQSVHQSVGNAFFLTTQIEWKWHRITGKVDI